MHGVGVSVVNALSEELHVTVWRGGVRYSQSYSRGAPTSALTGEELAEVDPDARRTGTQVRRAPWRLVAFAVAAQQLYVDSAPPW